MAQFALFWIQKDWIEDIYIIININTQNKDVTRATAFTAVTGLTGCTEYSWVTAILGYNLMALSFRAVGVNCHINV